MKKNSIKNRFQSRRNALISVISQFVKKKEMNPNGKEEQAKVVKGYNDLATLKPELVREWHSFRNGDLEPSDVSAGSQRNVYWLCGNNHIWEARIAERNKGMCCPYCRGVLL